MCFIRDVPTNSVGKRRVMGGTVLLEEVVMDVGGVINRLDQCLPSRARLIRRQLPLRCG